MFGAGGTGSFFDFKTPNARRSFVLLATGAVGGLLLAGFGLFTAKGTAMASVPPEDVALVNQRPILMADFIAQVEALTSVPFAQASLAQKKKALQGMIRDEIFVQRGLELDMPETDPDTRTALVAAVEQQVGADVAAQIPTGAQLLAYYGSHRSAYASQGTMTVIDFVGAPQVLASASAALNAGQAELEVARRYGLTDSKRTNGEEFYFAAKIHLGETLFAVAKTLRDRQASAPVPQPDGVHLLYMEVNSPPQPRTFVEAREQVLSDFKRDAVARLEAGEEKFLYGKADIQIARAYR
jgi:parvulin-like peptidyl-prolyl isomerase